MLFSKEVTYRVYDEFNPGMVQRQENGDLLVTVWMPYNEWVIGFLLSVGRFVEIIEPFALKEVIAERAKKYTKRINPDIGCQDFSDTMSARNCILWMYMVIEVIGRLLHL